MLLMVTPVACTAELPWRYLASDAVTSVWLFCCEGISRVTGSYLPVICQRSIVLLKTKRDTLPGGVVDRPEHGHFRQSAQHVGADPGMNSPGTDTDRPYFM